MKKKKPFFWLPLQFPAYLHNQAQRAMPKLGTRIKQISRPRAPGLSKKQKPKKPDLRRPGLVQPVHLIYRDAVDAPPGLSNEKTVQEMADWSRNLGRTAVYVDSLLELLTDLVIHESPGGTSAASAASTKTLVQILRNCNKFA